MGRENGLSDEQPVHTVILDPFWMDQTEVTNEMFAWFIEDSGYITLAEKDGSSWVTINNEGANNLSGADWQHPSGRSSNLQGKSDHPVVQISWHDAKEYCQWAGKRLPTEAEWELAARGSLSGARYPWGSEVPLCLPAKENGARFDDNNHCDIAGTIAVGSYQPNSFGLYDMAGNALEWVADWYGLNYYQISEQDNPKGPEEGRFKVARGGSWTSGEKSLGVAYRFDLVPELAWNSFGIRCVSDVENLSEGSSSQ